MREIIKTFSILSGKYYRGLRRRMARIPFIYQLYRRISFFSVFDTKALRLIERLSMLLSPDDRKVARIIQDHLAHGRYHETLYLADTLRKNGQAPSSMLLQWIAQACIELKAWSLFDQVYYPAFEELAHNVAKSDSRIKKEYCQGALEEAALGMTQNARIDMARKLLHLADHVHSNPRYQLLGELLAFIQMQEKEATLRAHSIRALHPQKEINVIGSIVWGEKYLNAFLRYNVRSMLAAGNMPHLRERGRVIHTIVTTEAGRDYVKNHSIYAELSTVAQVEFFCFPENLLGLFKGEDSPDKWSYMLYGILDHINLFFARGLGANLYLIPVDAIVANPSFTNMYRYLKEGFDCCGAGNLVANREGFLEAIDAIYGKVGALTIDTKSLATLALAHPHQYITSQLIHDDNKNFGKHARELFWPVKGGIAVHSIYTHPLAISARRLCGDYVMPYSWVDFLLAPRLFPDAKYFPKYKIIENAEEAYINNFAPASRQYETTGRAFNPQDFVAAHLHPYPIHCHMLTTRQFIPCETPPYRSSNNIDEDAKNVTRILTMRFGDFNLKSGASCHLCSSRDLKAVIDLGELPLSHQLRQSLHEKEKTFPLSFHYCNTCGLLQIRDSAPQDDLYDADTYVTGFQKPKHIDDLIISALSWRAPGAALDVGCNDGSLLRALAGYGFPFLAGIEPNRHAVALAEKNTAHSIFQGYLSAGVVEAVCAKQASFDFIFARHVLEHVSDIKDFFASLDRLLSPDGLLVLELPCVEIGFDANNPVILWEEHVNYFTIQQVKALLNFYGYEVLADRTYAFGGGSCAYIARRALPVPFNVIAPKSFSFEYFVHYAQAIAGLKQRLNTLIDQAREKGYRTVLYGAAPRSCTLVNFAKIGAKIDAVVDDRASIQGRYLPGTNQLITSIDQCKLGEKTMVLLGVGAENEHIVLAKLTRTLGYEPVSVSLFPPRDIYASVDAAGSKLTAASPSFVSPKIRIA